jgi:hypothetical protein
LRLDHQARRRLALPVLAELEVYSLVGAKSEHHLEGIAQKIEDQANTLE